MYRLVERALVVAAVVEQSGRRLERELVGLREILAPDDDWIQTKVSRDQICRSLDHLRCLGPSRSAIRVGRHLICEHRGYVHLNRRNLVTAGEHQPGQRRDRRCKQLQVGAHIRGRCIADGNGSIVLTTNLDIADLSAIVNRRPDVF